MKPNNHEPNQGEGDKASARKYNRNVKRFVRENRVEPAAQEAKTFVETAPDQATRDELAGLRPRKSEAEVTVDKLLAHGRGMFDRVAVRMRSAVDRVRSWYDKQR